MDLRYRMWMESTVSLLLKSLETYTITYISMYVPKGKMVACSQVPFPYGWSTCI